LCRTALTTGNRHRGDRRIARAAGGSRTAARWTAELSRTRLELCSNAAGTAARIADPSPCPTDLAVAGGAGAAGGCLSVRRRDVGQRRGRSGVCRRALVGVARRAVGGRLPDAGGSVAVRAEEATARRCDRGDECDQRQLGRVQRSAPDVDFALGGGTGAVVDGDLSAAAGGGRASTRRAGNAQHRYTSSARGGGGEPQRVAAD